MTGEEFMRVYEDRELRYYIWVQACRRTRKQEIREELVQEAWLVISLAPGDYSTDAYKRLVGPIVHSAYRVDYKEWQMMHHFAAISAEIRMSHEYPSADPQELKDAGMTVYTPKEWRKAKRKVRLKAR